MRQGRHEALANRLAWFSIALGLTELFMTRGVARATGLEGREALLRAYGVREIGTGAAILLARDKSLPTWARVAGDALDIATLASARNARARAAMGAVAGVTALDAYAAIALAGKRHRTRPRADYRSRSGFSRPPAEMRGIAAGQPGEKRGPIRNSAPSIPAQA